MLCVPVKKFNFTTCDRKHNGGLKFELIFLLMTIPKFSIPGLVQGLQDTIRDPGAF